MLICYLQKPYNPGMTHRQDQPEILRLDLKAKWADAYRKRAMASGNTRRAFRAANLVTALESRMDATVIAAVAPFSGQD